MKKTKLLTSLVALALVLGLGSCEVNVDVGGDVTIGGDTTSEDSGDTTSEESPTETSSEDDTTEDSTDVSTSENDGEGGSTDNSSDGSTVIPPEGGEGTTSNTIDEIKFVVTLYYNNEAQKCSAYGYMAYRGSFNGYLDEDNFLCDGEMVKLEETTNEKGEVAYTYTFTDVLISNSEEYYNDHSFAILFYYNNEQKNGNYSNQLIQGSIASPVSSEVESGSTLSYEITLESPLLTLFPDPEAEKELPGPEPDNGGNEEPDLSGDLDPEDLGGDGNDGGNEEPDLSGDLEPEDLGGDNGGNEEPDLSGDLDPEDLGGDGNDGGNEEPDLSGDLEPEDIGGDDGNGNDPHEVEGGLEPFE